MWSGMESYINESQEENLINMEGQAIRLLRLRSWFVMFNYS